MLRRRVRAMKRQRPEIRSPYRRTPEQGGDEAYLRWVRTLPCCMCGARPPSHAHHKTGAGMALKAPDRETLPLCRKDHRDLHDGNGRFDGWSREHKREWQLEQIAQLSGTYEERKTA